MMLRVIFLLILMSGCANSESIYLDKTIYLLAIDNCIRSLDNNNSFLVDGESGKLIPAYNNLKIVDYQDTSISHIQLGVSLEKHDPSIISDEPSGTCWFDENASVVALKAPESEESIGVIEYKKMSDEVRKKHLTEIRGQSNNKIRKVSETVLVSKNEKWVVYSHKERESNVDKVMLDYIDKELKRLSQ